MSDSKKVAKKAPAKSAPKHDEGKDRLRAYEHLGRVEALRHALGKHTGDIDTLTKLAEQELAGSHAKDAADLLRAAEHLSFAHLAAAKVDATVDPALAAAVKQEFEQKLEKAHEHWDDSEALTPIYQKALGEAQKAYDDGAYRRSLELVRAAEALAHVHLHDEEESAEDAEAA